MRLSHTSKALYGTPWAIEERSFDIISDIFQSHLRGEVAPIIEGKKVGETDVYGRIDKTDPGPGYDLEDGVAIIQIEGPIMPKAGMVGNVSKLAHSSQKIAASAMHAASNPEATSILLRIDSPGGSVLGGFEAADALYQAASQKPMVALIEGVGASLAYLFASQAGEIYATRGSIVGSIGVIARMPITDRMERNAGIDLVTVATSRDKAMSGLSEGEIRERMQAEVQKYFGMMKDTIARGRSGMDMDAVATGKTWQADEAMELGAIDGIATYEELFGTMKKEG